jgi:hypothetical protein
MQLQFTREEQALLVEVLQESSLAGARNAAKDNLLTRLLDRDFAFRYDELEDLSDFLADVSRHLHDDFTRTENQGTMRRQASVQRMLDKVIEAEAMV